MSDDEPLLRVEGLKKHYPITEGLLKREVGRVRAVDGISFEVRRGETFGLVGESGCGKSTAATTTLRLEEPTEGRIYFDGEDVTGYDRRQLERFRRRAQIIFQNPDSSFDPRMSVGESIAEPLRVHGLRDRKRRREIAADLLERVGLSAGDVDRYPHEFSGGQKQRIAIARAMVVNPELIVADEPVSALDVSIQADVLSLLGEIQAEFGLAMLFISHNLGVIREICDRVGVMYLGELVEVAPTETLFADPQHPYTRALLASIPRPDPRDRGGGERLTGDVPSPANPPTGCRFHTRCPEIIQPEGYEFEQGAWRAVMDFRERLSKGIDLDAIRETAAVEAGVDPERAAEATVDDDRLRGAVRDEFALPGTLADPDAEAVLSTAIERVIDGEDDAAAALLAEEFATPCETRHPELEPTEAGHPAACLLHEDDVDSEPVERRRASSDD